MYLHSFGGLSLYLHIQNADLMLNANVIQAMQSTVEQRACAPLLYLPGTFHLVSEEV